MIVEAKEGFSTASEGSYLAALTTDLTHELKLEGLAREFVRRVQNLRKSADLNVDDMINVQYASSELLSEAVSTFEEYITEETLAADLRKVEKPKGDFNTEDTFDGEDLVVGISVSK